ncbi:Arv1 protein [Entophlyctis helioformis]|nr:Arv1 protein [Entophlyctis helioformis]
MPVCIECGEPVNNLYIEYGRGNIKLLQCDKCQTFADKYLEYDFVIIFIDMLLHKRPVYRHLLFNRLSYTPAGWNSGLVKLAILLVLFEVYMKWFRLDRMDKAVAPAHVALHAQYIYILGICAIETFMFHLGVRLCAGIVTRGTLTRQQYNQMSMALVVSSFGKILLIVMVVWDYGNLDPSFLVNVLVCTSNMEALSVFLKTRFATTFAVLGTGMLFKLGAQYCIRKYDPNIELTFI